MLFIFTLNKGAKHVKQVCFLSSELRLRAERPLPPTPVWKQLLSSGFTLICGGGRGFWGWGCPRDVFKIRQWPCEIQGGHAGTGGMVGNAGPTLQACTVDNGPACRRAGLEVHSGDLEAALAFPTDTIVGATCWQ